MSSDGGSASDDLRPPRPRSGGGGASGGNAGGGSFCDIVERTRVNSVIRTVLVTLRHGDLLSIVYDAGPPKRLVLQTTSGMRLGSITSPSLPGLIQCILAGNTYVAEILLIQGGICEVEIRRR